MKYISDNDTHHSTPPLLLSQCIINLHRSLRPSIHPAERHVLVQFVDLMSQNGERLGWRTLSQVSPVRVGFCPSSEKHWNTDLETERGGSLHTKPTSCTMTDLVSGEWAIISNVLCLWYIIHVYFLCRLHNIQSLI